VFPFFDRSPFFFLRAWLFSSFYRVRECHAVTST
jgi:hypothetical protein